jgi:hypothetical protein
LHQFSDDFKKPPETPGKCCFERLLSKFNEKLHYMSKIYFHEILIFGTLEKRTNGRMVYLKYSLGVHTRQNYLEKNIEKINFHIFDFFEMP